MDTYEGFDIEMSLAIVLMFGLLGAAAGTMANVWANNRRRIPPVPLQALARPRDPAPAPVPVPAPRPRKILVARRTVVGSKNKSPDPETAPIPVQAPTTPRNPPTATPDPRKIYKAVLKEYQSWDWSKSFQGEEQEAAASGLSEKPGGILKHKALQLLMITGKMSPGPSPNPDLLLCLGYTVLVIGATAIWDRVRPSPPNIGHGHGDGSKAE